MEKQPKTKDVYAFVTNQIIAQLEKGTVPWIKPWRGTSVPRNLITQRPYRGINRLLLNFLDYPQKEFLTWNQVKDLGGSVLKGEEAHLVVYWKKLEPDQQKEEEKPKYILRYYYVFNVLQCTNLPKGNIPEPLKFDEIEMCEEIIVRMPLSPEICHKEQQAYYSAYFDYINMPKPETFVTSEAYYATLFHELIHSTGGENRLHRKEITEMPGFTSSEYALEELTAEIGACFLCSFAGIASPKLENSAAYIKDWLKRLKNDKKFVIKASAQAQRAMDYILNIRHQDSEVMNHIQNDGSHV